MAVHLPPLDGATEWLNSGPLGPTDLRGRVAVRVGGNWASGDRLADLQPLPTAESWTVSVSS